MSIAIPETNPARPIGTSLGVTFPFKIFLGISLYRWVARLMPQGG